MSKKIPPAEQETRRNAATAAAIGVFERYGYGRATMVDLASAAHLSRPGLYELFPGGKEEIFSAAVRKMSSDTIGAYRAASPKLKTTGGKLHRFCGDWATHGLRLVAHHPDARDLFDLRFPAVREMYEDFVAFLTELIAAHSYNGKIALAEVVRNLVYSFRGLEEAAQNVEQMEQMVGLQVDVFLATLTPEAPPNKVTRKESTSTRRA